jgi:hypothetical protein
MKSKTKTEIAVSQIKQIFKDGDVKSFHSH